MNKYDKALKANNKAFCNCFQAFYNQIGHLQARALYRQALRESRRPEKAPASTPSYRRPYVLPVLDENITRHLEWATADVKPYIDETFKRVGIEDKSGIYKLTNLDSGKSYIGKSTNIKKRITDHFKSSIGIKTIAD